MIKVQWMGEVGKKNLLKRLYRILYLEIYIIKLLIMPYIIFIY